MLFFAESGAPIIMSMNPESKTEITYQNIKTDVDSYNHKYTVNPVSYNGEAYPSISFSKTGHITHIGNIAATALSNNLILVTRNTKDFEPICQEFPLHVENWFE